MESIINAVKLEGTPDVDYIKVHIENVKEEKIVIVNEAENQDSNDAPDDSKSKKVEIEGAEDDGFEITEN